MRKRFLLPGLCAVLASSAFAGSGDFPDTYIQFVGNPVHVVMNNQAHHSHHGNYAMNIKLDPVKAKRSNNGLVNFDFAHAEGGHHWQRSNYGLTLRYNGGQLHKVYLQSGIKSTCQSGKKNLIQVHYNANGKVTKLNCTFDPSQQVAKHKN